MSKRHIGFALAASLAVASGAAGADDYALAYHGKLVRADSRLISTKVPMSMEFRLCACETPDGSAPLWGRRTTVRFDDGGLFYIELRDSSGTQIDGARYKSLSEAASVAGTNAWISVTPVGYGELLPRKRLGAIHRAELAGCAAGADMVVAPKLKMPSADIRELSVKGDLSVTGSFAAGGGEVVNTVTADGVSLGKAAGTVLFSDTFDNWSTFTTLFDGVGHVSADTLIAYPADSSLGAFSIPLPRGSSTTSLPTDRVTVNSFIKGFYNPFF